jgi:RNA polymerase sigma-54 factor
MKPTLQVRLSQHLSLTPQLQQSIRLLQLSTLELQQEIEQMLEQNPFLEVDGDEGGADALAAPSAEPPVNTERQAEREARNDEAALREESGAPDEAPGLDTAEFGTTEREDWENGTEREDFDGIAESPVASSSASASNAEGEDFEAGERGAPSESLQDHLRAQIVGMRLSAEDAAALAVLVDSLDEDGYLADTLEDIAGRLAGTTKTPARSCWSGSAARSSGCKAWSRPASARATSASACACNCARCRAARRRRSRS